MENLALDTNKSIEQLEGVCWLPPVFASNVILRAHAVRRKPLAQFTLPDISVALIQQVGVSYVIPMAIDVVEQDPFAASRFYEGDLLCALLQIPNDYWAAHEQLRDRVGRVYERAESDERAQHHLWSPSCVSWIREAHARFRGELPPEPWLRPVEHQQEREAWGAGQPDPNWGIELVPAGTRPSQRDVPPTSPCR